MLSYLNTLFEQESLYIKLIHDQIPNWKLRFMHRKYLLIIRFYSICKRIIMRKFNNKFLKYVKYSKKYYIYSFLMQWFLAIFNISYIIIDIIYN